MEKRYDSPLKNLKVASPCSADWDRMAGDDRKRFCGDCKLHVYNLSGMTKYDAENLLRLSEGRLCVRYFQRADGTVLTLTDTLEELGKAARDAAGWHYCLDRFDFVLDGRPRKGDDSWKQLNDMYIERFGPAASTIGPPEGQPETS